MIAPVRVGLVGCGRLAERGYLPAFALSQSVALVAVADRDEGQARTLAPGLRCHGSARNLLTHEDVELLVLAHAADAHVPDALAAATAGVFSLVEKPPAKTATEVGELVGIEPSAWLGFNRRFEPAIGELRSRLARTSPASLELELSIQSTVWGARDGSEAVLLDLGPHLVDLAVWLTGRSPSRVRVASLTDSDAAFDIDLDGLIASVSISHERGWRERVTARDARGRTVARVARGGLVRRVAARTRRGAPGPLAHTLALQLAAAGRAVRGGAIDPRLATARDGVAVMEVLDAVAAARGLEWETL